VKSFLQNVFSIRRMIHPVLRVILVALPFVLVVLLYASGSISRHRENPQDRLMPGVSQIIEGVKSTIEVNPRTETVWLIQDLKHSLKLIAIAMTMSVVLAVTVGLFMGAFEAIEAFHLPFVKFFSFIPPLALLPLVFIYFGTGFAAKILIIFLGTYFLLVIDVYLKVRDVPIRLVNKAYTLGASTIEVVFKVILRGAWPKILDSIRLSFRQAWIYLIAAELIAAEAGLGYRINVVQRQLGVNIILWYIFLIGMIGFSVDFLIVRFIRYHYGWSMEKRS
jgi:NitT/TauT family transport system permease protein